MKLSMLPVIALLSTLFAITGNAADLPNDYAVVANRGSGTLSYLDAKTGQVFFSRALREQSGSEPMYVVHLKSRGLIAVGDRQNSKIVLISDKTAETVAVVPTARGVFHMYADPSEKRLFVAADQDNVIDIVDLNLRSSVSRFAIPSSFTAQGGKAHDVTADETFIYATITGIVADGKKSDRVLKIDQTTLAIEGVFKTDFDAHVAISADGPSDYLVVASQAGGSVQLLQIETLQVLAKNSFPNAHGLQFFGTGTNKYIFSTNIGDGGANALRLLKFDDINYKLGVGIITFFTNNASAPIGTPHNIATSLDSDLVFVTHSGANQEVSLFTKSPSGVSFAKSITTGKNPFGLALVQRGN
ncbi:MAG: hypothetical protein EOP06_10025 [Proteobacteria bacterium]|nr:MAG: hypothetical protein EOP06_10025 [Pseudomonadota bacterium]